MRYWKMGFALLLVPLILFVLKLTIEAQATARARDLLAAARQVARNDVELATVLTARIHADFTKSSDRGGLALPAKLQALLTHRFMPAPLRIRQGAFEIISLQGECGSAGRALIMALGAAGFNADQLNMVTPTAAHTAVVVTLQDKSTMTFDPFFGVVAHSGERLIGPAEARMLARNGLQMDAIWTRLAPSSDPEFYRQFENVRFARQGEPLEFGGEVTLPGEPLQLGEADGSSSDVSNAAAMAGLTPYWHYIGHRYDRSWVRWLTVNQDTLVTIALVEPLGAKFITSELPPQVHGNRLTYHLAAGSTLRFVDGRAGYDWLRLRSYIDVDYMRFERATVPPLS